MKRADDTLARMLGDMPVPALAPALRARAYGRACSQLAPPTGAPPEAWRRNLPAFATSAALLSADAVFLADACLKMGRVFGG